MARVDACWTDGDLAAAARAGSESAWGVLVDRHYAPLLGYLAARTGDKDLAADLVQDTFASAVGLLHRFGNDRPFRAWLYRIAQNHLHRVWYWRKLHRVVSLDWLTEQAGHTAELSSRSDAFEDAVAGEELVLKILAGISPPLREAILLHSFSGFTAPEVAEILGVSLAAAERRISRGKEQFRQRYRAVNRDEQGEDETAWVLSRIQ
jgi:RNA polymerase sigma-70 factor (ECF subfamily)